jgi:hypothetical protein
LVSADDASASSRATAAAVLVGSAVCGCDDDGELATASNLDANCCVGNLDGEAVIDGRTHCVDRVTLLA